MKVTNQEVEDKIEDTQEKQNPPHFVHDGIDMEEVEVVISQVGYKALFDNMPNGCAYYKVLFDEKGNPVDLIYMKVNSAYEENMGFSVAQLIGKRVTEIFPQLTKASAQWIDKYMDVALFGEPVAFSQYFDHADKWYSLSAYSPQRGYVVSIMEDITEKKRHAEKVDQYASALRERNNELNTSQSRYRGLLDHMHNIFEYHRVIADENGRPIDLEFEEVNPAFEKRTGLKIADVIGKRLPVANHGIDNAYWIQILGDVALTRQPVVLEQYLEKTDTWYRISAYSPEEGHVASILEDITEQKKAEAIKSENQRQVALIEKVASLGALATGVAHEINQPLQALKIMADGMIYWFDKGKETSMKKVIENCRRISVQAGYITAIVEWMQDSVNRSWSDTPQEVDVNKMVKQSLNMVQERVKAHRVELHSHLCATSPMVWGDVRRLEEVVIIILVNAIESLAGDDQARRKIVVTTLAVENRAIIQISNNGPAVPDDIMGKIFEPFFSYSKSDASLGMGLAIVKSIVNAHNGTIHVSNVDQQVLFCIDLPLYVSPSGI